MLVLIGLSFISIIFSLKNHHLRYIRSSIIKNSKLGLSHNSDYLSLLNTRVYGNTSSIRHDHPVIKAVIDRWGKRSTPGRQKDDYKIGLAIEGGGMRGCVAAGATAGLNFLGLNDCVDVVYGSSAGAMIGAYFISRQFSGIAIYHDIIPAAGKEFIDKGLLLRALGLSFSLPRFFRRWLGRKEKHRGVLNIDFLLHRVMGRLQPLDWELFQNNESIQPLRIVTTCLRTMETRVLTRDNGHFHDLDSLLNCIKASMLVPGISSGLMAITASIKTPFVLPPQRKNIKISEKGSKKHSSPIASPESESHVPLVDAFLVEPIPFRCAVKEGCTHVIVLRTRPDPCPMLGRGPGIFERVIAKRFFREHDEHDGAAHLITQKHQVIYAKDVLLLNEACNGAPEGVEVEGQRVHLLPIAPSEGCVEVNQLETNKKRILLGMRDGARKVITIFGPSMNISLDQIEDIVQSILPDSILNRNIDLESYSNACLLEGGQSLPLPFLNSV